MNLHRLEWLIRCGWDRRPRLPRFSEWYVCRRGGRTDLTGTLRFHLDQSIPSELHFVCPDPPVTLLALLCILARLLESFEQAGLPVDLAPGEPGGLEAFNLCLQRFRSR